MQFINTRPEQRALALTLALQNAGYDVLELPLLSLSTLPLDAVLKQQYQEFDDADYVVVVSPTAAEIGLKYYKDLGYDDEKLKQKKWIAVGVATAQYLKIFGIDSAVPEVETSEGMLALNIFKEMTSQSIVFWRGIGGRTFMMDCLKNQGCTIINMLLYTRQLPLPNELTVSLVQYDAVTLITSEQSWYNWCELAKRFRWDITKFRYMVLADRVTEVLQQHFLKQQQKVQIITVSTLKQDYILAQLNKVFPNE